MHGCWVVAARGCAWLLGGMHGCEGACVTAGGAYMVAGGACIGHDKIRSMSWRYVSYWNAFLFCE